VEKLREWVSFTFGGAEGMARVVIRGSAAVFHNELSRTQAHGSMAD